MIQQIFKLCFLFTLPLILVIESCNQENKIENKIIKEINKPDIGKQHQVIILKDITDFSWDKVYIFNYDVSSEVIERAIQMPYPYYVEFKRHFIFIKNNKIIYYENPPCNMEKVLNNQVVFDFPDSLKYKMFTPENAIFRADKKVFEDSSGYYYLLYQISN